MASESLQYDAALGGPIRLPDRVDSERFNEARLAEVKQMLRTVASTENQTKLMHQSLPLHMRRRAMSYNPKRLPRRFRAIHVAQFSRSGMPEKKRRPSRKFRRKANNLLKEYERRKRSNVWLETHVWHAKRFHMVAKWGYKVPYSPTRKGYRACYRATAKHCLVQDVSYYGCVELRGGEGTLKESLKRFCSERAGLTICAKAFVSGKRSGNVWLFERDRYPLGCVGRVKFAWRPEMEGDDRRTLWIFAHPVFYRKLVEMLVETFGLRNANRDDEPMEVDQITRNAGNLRTPRYENSSSGVTLLELKDTLNYFRLTGPLAHAILSKSLKIYNPSNQSEQWFQDWSQDLLNVKTINEQTKFWDKARNLTSPGEISPGTTLGLVIADPRLNRPRKRTKALPPVVTVSPEPLPELSSYTASSPIWDKSIRDRITQEMVTTHQLNVRRTRECLVPGEPCAFESQVQPIPILLMQNAGSQDGDFKWLGYGAGWDVIVPSGYGLAFWHTLILWGAKPAGLKEFTMQAIESGIDSERVPDSVLGRTESDLAFESSWSSYFAKPNNRRVNYKKLAIASPFRCPWPQLVTEWNPTTDPDLFVLRDVEQLNKLTLALNRRFNIKSVQLPPNCLIPLLLTLKTRGNPGDNALICLPHRTDFNQNKKNRAANDHTPVYTEPLRRDPQQPERLALRRAHLALLKRLRARRIRAKKRQQRASPGQLVRIAKPATASIIREQLEKMRELWLPANPESIRSQCSRECFGYVTQSSFALSEGQVTGLGYVTARGLEKLFKICTKGAFKVLVRGTKSRCYRFASVKVRVE
uniref:Ribonucleases P/MRP protein subunit POP1 n=1 Tax=Culex pipiens TaxID=7175 RepID=A0A8D8NZ82_CULPI